MGLDLLVMNKPKAGYDGEFRTLMTRWFVHADVMNAIELGENEYLALEKAGSFQPTRKRSMTCDTGSTRFPVAAIASLGAPQVGADPAADQWVRDAFATGRFKAEVQTAESALRALTGYHVLELLPESDGLPV